MRRVSGRMVLVGCAMAALLLGACGDVDDGTGKDVTALNLETGEKQVFTGEDRVPGGWIVCINDRCPIPDHFSCQNLGPATCLLSRRCSLKLLCEFDIPGIPPIYRIEPQLGPELQGEEPVDAHDAGAAPCAVDSDDPNFGCVVPVQPVEPRYAPQGCEFVCRGPTPQPTCEEIRDPRACEANPKCDWEWLNLIQPLGEGHTEDGNNPSTESNTEVPSDVAAGMPCTPDYCPPLPQGFCRPAKPHACEQLDKYRCHAREDCTWDPMPCPCSERGCDMACGPFCRPRQNVCPPPPPVPLCKEGRIEQVYDEQGCLVGYKCADTTRCEVLRKEYDELLRDAKQCTPIRYLNEGCLGGPGPEGCIQPPDTKQCSITVPNGLGCMSCPTYINAEHGEAVEMLHDLRSEFEELGCMRNIACVAMACAMPRFGSCEYALGGSQASCVDHY